MTSFSSLSMYALTVQPPTAVQQAIVGDFAGTKQQQILVASGSRLTLLEVSRAANGSLREIHSHDVFGIIRKVAPFRLTGATKDCIAVSSDSGRIVTFEYLPDDGRFKTIHYETFGKSGIRRVVPGEYLAADPKGRALLLASVEKNKIVYILNRNIKGEVTISSPLEALRPNTLVYSCCALDVGYDNPYFVTLETNYGDADSDPTGEAARETEKELVYFELDLGLNHVARKWAEVVDRSANILFQVPGAPAGPGGVLVCGEDNISFRYLHNPPSGVKRLPIPRRAGATQDPNRKRFIVSGTKYTLKRGDFFFLLQSDDGDLFKVTFDLSPDPRNPKGIVDRIKIQYFDTVPVATSICILRSGYLFCAAESGDQLLYDLENIDSEDEEFTSDHYPAEPTASYEPAYFQVHPLQNLNLVRTIPSLNPIIGMHVANLTEEDAPQIYTISGTGARSTFRTSRFALDVLELVESQLPQRAITVWTTKKTIEDDYDSYIVLSLLTHTLVLGIGEDVEEAHDTGFIKETTTLGVQQFGEDGLVQIHPRGIRHIAFNGETIDWDAPQHRTIVACASNNRQVAIALSTGEIYYFQYDPDSGSISKHRDEAVVDGTVTCLGMGEVPEGAALSRFLAVGTDSNTVRLLTLFPDESDEILRQISVQALSSAPSSICIMEMRDRSFRGSGYYLHVGLRSGVYIRTAMDEHTGSLSETKRRFLGTTPIKFAKVLAGDDPALLCMTSRPWLAFTDSRDILTLAPLNHIAFDSAWTFSSSQFKGIICVRGEDLRIFALEDLGKKLSQQSIQLQYTPRAFACSPELGLFYVAESENNTLDPDTRALLEAQAAKEKDGDTNMEVHTNGDLPDGEEDPLSPAKIGYPRATGRWSSCIQIVDPLKDGGQGGIVQTIELGKNRCAVSLCVVNFESRPGEMYLAVGVAKDLAFDPAKYKYGRIHLYRILEGGRKLEFCNKTKLPHPPLALLAFKGRLAVGVGRDLGLYDIGMKSLLRKAQQVDCTETQIVGLKTQGSRIIVADKRESVTFVVHKDVIHPNRLIPFADDTVPRHTTCVEMVDYDSVVGGDKFGNLWMVRCPAKISEQADEPNDGGPLLQEKQYLNGAPFRTELIMHFFANDIPMGLQKTHLVAGGEKVLLWAGLQGTLGVMIPFQSRKDFKMFQQLESLLRQHEKPLAGRDHLAFRSYYTPVKGTIDGDLIERFLVMPRDNREMVAAQLEGGWTVAAVETQIWNMRGLYAF